MNKWIGIGRLTKDSELRFTAGKGTANLTLAVDNYNSSTKEKGADYIPIVVWGKQAESLSSYLIKGTQAAVSGKIQTRSYDAKDGTKRYVTEIVADAFGGIKLLGSKGKGQDTDGSNNFGNMNQDTFGGGNFEEDITPVNDGDMPF